MDYFQIIVVVLAGGFTFLGSLILAAFIYFAKVKQ